MSDTIFQIETHFVIYISVYRNSYVVIFCIPHTAINIFKNFLINVFRIINSDSLVWNKFPSYYSRTKCNFSWHQTLLPSCLIYLRRILNFLKANSIAFLQCSVLLFEILLCTFPYFHVTLMCRYLYFCTFKIQQGIPTCKQTIVNNYCVYFIRSKIAFEERWYAYVWWNIKE